MAIRVTNAAMQIMGAEGYSKNHPVERMLRDARMFTFGGGTTEIQRLNIASQVLAGGCPSGESQPGGPVRWQSARWLPSVPPFTVVFMHVRARLQDHLAL